MSSSAGPGAGFSVGITPEMGPRGVCIEFLPGKEGLIHISQLSEARVEKMEDVVNVGDQVTVNMREIDNRGRINLTFGGVPQQGPAPAG